MYIKGKTSAMEGTIEGQSVFHLEGQRSSESRITCNDIDVKTFFQQSKNFDQSTITDKHLAGALNAKIAIDAYWDENGNFLKDNLKAIAEVNIKDGELNNFPMLRRFSDYIKIQDLRNIRFASLQNYLKIEDQKLHIPCLLYTSDAADD